MREGGRRPGGAAALAAAVAAAAALAAAGATPVPGAHAQEDPCGEDAACTAVGVGALLARGEAFDEQRWAAFSAAAGRFNAMQDGMAERVLINLTRHDLVHGAAHEAISAAHGGGTGPLYYLGPTFSSDVAGVSEYAGENGLVVVSPSSSAASLAVQGDGIYRTTAPVDREAGAMAGLIVSESVHTVVPAAQNGEFGTSTLETMSAALEAAGIAVADPVRFDAHDMDTWRAALPSIDSALAAEPGSAVLLVIGFETDFGGMAAAAASFESAGSARWFVPSGAIDPELALGGIAAEAARDARATTLVIEDAAGGADARAAVRADMAAAGMNATSYDYSASDAVFVLGGAVRLAAEGGADASAPAGAAAVRSNMLAAARLHDGALGDVRLDAAGDLSSPISYGVWSFGDGGWERMGAVQADDSFCTAGIAGSPGCTDMGIVARTGSADDEAAAEAVLLAVDDYNSRLQEGGAPSAAAPPYIEARILGMNESGSSPARAAIASAAGPAAYVGPLPDDDLASLRDAAAEAGVLLFSAASAGPSLAVPGDGVFRLAARPSTAAAAALAAMSGDGVGTMAIVDAGGGGGGGAGAMALSDLAPSYGIGTAGVFAYRGEGDAAAAATAADAAAALAAEGDGLPPNALAVAIAGAAPADVEALAAAAGASPILISARWYVVDEGGYTALRPAGPALASLAGTTSISSVHAQYDEAAGEGAAGRIAYAVGDADAPPSLLYASYDAAMLAAGALGTLPAGSTAGNTSAAAAAAASVIPAAATYNGILGDVSLDAAGDLAPPSVYVRRTAPAVQGAGWAAAAGIQVPALCSMSIAREMLDFGDVRAGDVSGEARQTIANSGTVPFALSVHASGWSAGGSPVLPASATEFSVGVGFAPLPDGPAAVRAGAGQVAPGGSLDIDYRLNLDSQPAEEAADAEAAAGPAAGTRMIQTVSYEIECPQ